jgi:hypothetical protein
VTHRRWPALVRDERTKVFLNGKTAVTIVRR